MYVAKASLSDAILDLSSHPSKRKCYLLLNVLLNEQEKETEMINAMPCPQHINMNHQSHMVVVVVVLPRQS